MTYNMDKCRVLLLHWQISRTLRPGIHNAAAAWGKKKKHKPWMGFPNRVLISHTILLVILLIYPWNHGFVGKATVLVAKRCGPLALYLESPSIAAAARVPAWGPPVCAAQTWLSDVFCLEMDKANSSWPSFGSMPGCCQCRDILLLRMIQHPENLPIILQKCFLQIIWTLTWKNESALRLYNVSMAGSHDLTMTTTWIIIYFLCIPIKQIICISF